MKDFFKVTELDAVLAMVSEFKTVGTEVVDLFAAAGRVLAEDFVVSEDLPDFARSTMDGFAVRASSTFGASDGNPAFLTIVGSIAMGESPDFSVSRGEAARISTGGMLPEGTDSVVMVEYTETLDETALEVYRSVAPGQNIIEKGEDFSKDETILHKGQRLRSQEVGLLAAFGCSRISVYKRPVVGIISTGDEIVSVDEKPGPAQIRDINTYSLSSLISGAGGVPESCGIVGDDYDALLSRCALAQKACDMVLISGGSSVGARDFTIDVLAALPEAEILVHGISISPGKPTILSRSQKKAIWGLPGHVVSSMVVFHMAVRPFIESVGGQTSRVGIRRKLAARLLRNVSSAQGRIDCIRVRLLEKAGELWAEPILGKSALINTMVKADGLIAVGMNSEGLEKGAGVSGMLI
jgi:molybdopterin molybdotransferase